MLLQSALAAVLLCIAFHGFKASAGRGEIQIAGKVSSTSTGTKGFQGVRQNTQDTSALP